MSSASETKHDRSEELFARAIEMMPGGVNSPVRAFRAVGGTPRFISSASGATITDVDGRTYIDYVGSWGPMILGHADPEIVAALKEAATRGTSFGAPNEREVELAEEIIDAVPSIEMVRMVSSGTEATMSAIRLARGVTGRNKIVTMAMAIVYLSKPARALPLSDCRTAPVFPHRSPRTRSRLLLMMSPRWNKFFNNTLTLRQSSSSRLWEIWDAFHPSKAT